MRPVRPVLLLALAATLLGACAAATAGQPGVPRDALVIECDELSAADGAAGAALERTIDATAGETIRVSLCSNPSTGFSWEAPAIADPTALQLVDRAVVEGDGTAIGRAGLETFTFRVAKAGASEIRFAYSQPWEGGTKGAATVVLTVEAS